MTETAPPPSHAISTSCSTHRGPYLVLSPVVCSESDNDAGPYESAVWFPGATPRFRVPTSAQQCLRRHTSFSPSVGGSLPAELIPAGRLGGGTDRPPRSAGGATVTDRPLTGERRPAHGAVRLAGGDPRSAARQGLGGAGPGDVRFIGRKRGAAYARVRGVFLSRRGGRGGARGSRLAGSGLR